MPTIQMLRKTETSLDAIHKSDETKEENPANNSRNWTSNERQAKLKVVIALMMMLALLWGQYYKPVTMLYGFSCRLQHRWDNMSTRLKYQIQ